MKHFKLFIAILLALVPLFTWADAVEIDGIYYNLSAVGDTAVVTVNPNQYSGDIVIPDEVNYGKTYKVYAIGEKAFQYNKDVTSVQIGANVVEIKGNAFYNTGITNLVIPEGVTRIEHHAFMSNSKLESLTLPTSLVYIGNQTFGYCTKLQSVTIPKNVNKVEVLAFSGCDNLTSLVVEQGNAVYDSRNNCNALIETASDKLVLGCKSTVIPNDVKTIGYEAFWYCRQLSSIVIPTSVTTIESGAFNNTALTSIAIPSSVIDMGTNPFADCYLLSTITVDAGNPIYESVNNCLINKNVGQLVAGCSTSVIPDNVEYIGGCAFEGQVYLMDITIPEGVRAIGYNAFSGCPFQTLTLPNSVQVLESAALSGMYMLKTVHLGSGVLNIGDNLFYGCQSLTDIYINATNVPVTSYYAFQNINNQNPLTVHVPSTAIEAYQAVSPWSTMTLVGDAEEAGGSSLTSTFNSWQQTAVGGNYTSGIMKSEEGNNWQADLAGQDTPVEPTYYGPDEDHIKSCLMIGNGVSGDFGFWLYNQFQIPAGPIQKIVVSAAGNFSTMLARVIERNNPESYKQVAFNRTTQTGEIEDCEFDFEGAEFTDPVVEINIAGGAPIFLHKIAIVQNGGGEESLPSGKCGDNLSYALTLLPYTVSVPNEDTGLWEDRTAVKLTITGTGAMYDYAGWYNTPWTDKYRYRITEIEMPEGMTRVGDNAFGGIIHAQVDGLPSTLTSIGYEAFYNIFYMPSELRIPSGVVSVGGEAFTATYGTRKVYIPAKLTDIGEGAFAEMRDLEQFIVEDANPVVRVEDNALIKIASNTMIATTKDAKIPAGVKHIGTKALAGIKVESIVIPEGVETIGKEAFLYATITEINIPNSVTTIGEGAFNDCEKATKVTIGSGVTSIGIRAFAWSTNILDVVCYANPAGLTWATSESYDYDSKSFKPDKATKMHVRAADVETWQTKFPFLNVTFVGDLGAEIAPITEETTVDMTELKNEGTLADKAVDNVYYNLDENKGCGYDEQRNCLVIGKATNMSLITDATPGSADVKENFNGIIVEVGPGRGTITINAQTVGRTSLAVRIGNGTPTYAAHDERWNVYVTYDVTEPTYVYIYAVDGVLVRGNRKAEAGQDALLIYDITVTPTENTPTGITTAEQEIGQGEWYDLNGQAVAGPRRKGVYIRDGRKVVVK